MKPLWLVACDPFIALPTRDAENNRCADVPCRFLKVPSHHNDSPESRAPPATIHLLNRHVSAANRFAPQLCLQRPKLHDKLRKGAQRYAKKARKPLIKNGRFFVAPRKTDENFKRLFARLAAAGAGRPVDNEGFADGPWTPESLAEAISAIDGNREGVELRSVQVWFQDNDNGISDTNIRWLARIFGCGDPEAASEWQAELKAAKERLAGERREKKRQQTTLCNGSDYEEAFTETSVPQFERHVTEELVKSEEQVSPQAKTLAEKCERMLSGATSLNLQFGYWMVFCGLGVMNYVLGTLSVTYTPQPGLEKQVGFIWAPTLTVLPIIALPAFIFFVSNMNTYWRETGRRKCVSGRVVIPPFLEGRVSRI